MTVDIGTPQAIADRAAGRFEAEFARLWALLNPGAPPATVDARSPYSTLAIHARVLGMTAFDIKMLIAVIAREMFVDTASVDGLPSHAVTWTSPRIAATAFAGTATFTGQPGRTIPSGVILSAPGGGTLTTTAPATFPGGGTVSAPIAAAVAGAAGTVPTGTVLTVVNPLDSLTVQTAVVDAGGAPGEDAEDPETWRARIIARIRQRGAGGSAGDFIRWTQEVYPTALVYAWRVDTGIVRVTFAMPTGSTWRAPTDGEVAAVYAYLNDASARKPLGCPEVVVIAATIQSVNVSISLTPDTADTRAAATAALTSFFLAAATIGGTIFLSNLDAALSNSSGETSHERSAPSADVTAATTTLSVLGTVTFT